MKFPTPNYRGLETAPRFVVAAADFRFVHAFPVLLDGSDLDKRYQPNAERCETRHEVTYRDAAKAD